jgi:hypothetical protein
MPYIKYRGFWSGGIREEIRYEDPDALCRTGLLKTLAEARREAERAYNDPTESANSIQRYVSDHPYPGLLHVGGIGFLEALPLPPFCEEISATEYQKLRTDIEKENAAYRIMKDNTLVKNNDPARRGTPEHEKFGWRTRIWATSYTELEHHVAYPLGDRSVAYLRIREHESSGSGRTAQLIDIYHSTDGDIQQALLEGIDWADILVDLLSVTGFGAARLEAVLGTTVPYARIGEEFSLATFGAQIHNDPVPVSPSSFSKGGMDAIGLLALRHLREGLAATAPTTAFAAFWKALEVLGTNEAKAKGWQQLEKCVGCGAQRSVGFELKRGFEAMYTQAGIDPKLYRRHRKTRAVIQHGERLPSTHYATEVFQDLPQIQTAAMVAVAERIRIAPATRTYWSTCWPVTVFACRAQDDGNISVQNSSMKSHSALNTLPQRVSGDAGRRSSLGIPSKPNINPLSFPPIEL